MDRGFFPSSYILDSTLRQILASIKPLEADRVRRNNVINEFIAVVGCVESLRGRGHNLQLIPNARVPLLIFQTSHPFISCDISISNLLGQIKSKILLWITEIDERFRDMVLLIKEWAKAQHINDPKTGTLNSYSLCLLVIFHFQTCTPPILPPLKDIYAGNIVNDLTGMRSVVERRIQDTCTANIRRFRFIGFRQVNRSSLSELLISFFEKFSTIDVRAAGYAICTYTGQWEPIMSHDKWMQKPYKLFIEDPFEQPENSARAVGTNQLIEISEAFQRTYHLLSSASLDRNFLIANLVRPNISSMLGGTGHHPQLANSATTQNQHRMQHNLRLENRPTSSTTVQRPAGVYSPARRVQRWRPSN
ncbi:protein HESO1 isoform X2 [Magnolia sinica]|uniref:protein HESO1 isoform X2 n=1 Tax=Magnolia sinica TaxID=86752 RepID=UPI002657EC2F|nr:protein HESO1 isoform X2 [Magnolia sinica]